MGRGAGHGWCQISAETARFVCCADASVLYGGFNAESGREFFGGFAAAARAFHLRDRYGENAHHMIEALFKWPLRGDRRAQSRLIRARSVFGTLTAWDVCRSSPTSGSGNLRQNFLRRSPPSAATRSSPHLVVPSCRAQPRSGWWCWGQGRSGPAADRLSIARAARCAERLGGYRSAPVSGTWNRIGSCCSRAAKRPRGARPRDPALVGVRRFADRPGLKIPHTGAWDATRRDSAAAAASR